MDRLEAILLFVLVLAVTGVGLVMWRADRHARDAAAEASCLDRVQATALVALMVPTKSVDKEGRIQAVQTLGQRLDEC